MSSEKIHIIYLCNALDSVTRSERSVTLDSPAATNKVFGIAHALLDQDFDVHLVSLGKGRQTGSGIKYPSRTKTINEIKIHYAAFWQIKWITHFVATFSLTSAVRKIMSMFSGKIIVIAYNRLWQYLPALIYAKIHGAELFLDLEDGPIASGWFIGRLKDSFSKYLFGSLCNKGAIIVAKNLANQIWSRHTYVCYGTTEIQNIDDTKWSKRPITILFGGTLIPETGVHLFMDSIAWLEQHMPELKEKITFSVTGQGLLSGKLFDFSKTAGRGWISFLGTVDRETYFSEITKAQIGLNLRVTSSEMGKTTFPSKVLEYASYGLAIISTRVSDVPDLLDDHSAIFLPQETPENLAIIFKNVASEFYDLKSIGHAGQNRVNSVCNREVVGAGLKQFLLE